VADSAPPERDTAFLVSAGIAVVALFVLARNLLPVKQDLADTNRRIEALKAERDALQKEREVLEMKEKALQGDDRYLERTLRGQTGMSKPGEFIVR